MEQEKDMASLKDISKICGVSVATVSKALNDHKDIGEETKATIRRVAKEMGYSPNLSARALKTNRTYGIGVLFADEARSGLTHDYFSSVLDSFKRTAEKSGYDITFINSCKNRPDRMSYLEHSRYRGFDGVVLACIDFGDPEVIELVQSSIPVVTIDYLFNNRIAIMSDNVAGMKELLDLPNPPTCIIYPDDFASFGGINAIRQRGLQIPEDISVAGYDGIQAARQLEPRLTTVQQDTEQIGCLAARELISLIERPKTTIIEQVIVPGKVAEGKSVARIPTDN